MDGNCSMSSFYLQTFFILVPQFPIIVIIVIRIELILTKTLKSFMLFLYSNPVVSCEEIKKVNLEAWQDSVERPDILARTNKWIKDKVIIGENKI